MWFLTHTWILPALMALSFVLMGVMMALLSGQAMLINRARKAGTYD